MRLITTLHADSAGRPYGTEPLMEFGGALAPVEELITVMKEFRLPGPVLVETPNSPDRETAKKLKYRQQYELPEIEIFGKVKGELTLGVEFGTKRAGYTPMDPNGSVELFVEVEGEVQLPIIKPLYGGGFLRLAFAIGLAPAEKEKLILELKLAAGVTGSLGNKNLIPGILGVAGTVRYGYVFVADFASGEYHPGVLLGFALECDIKHLVKVSFEAEVIGLVKRVDEEEIHVRAEFTIAGEVEVFGLVDGLEYSVETEWDQHLPMKALIGLVAAYQFGLLPIPIPP
jgi:hypothetical protein